VISQSTPKIVKNPTRTSEFNKISPPEIFQIPQVGKSCTGKKHRHGRTVILTSSTYKEDLEMSALYTAPGTELYRKSTKKLRLSLEDSSTSSDNDDTACVVLK
jgi:hypothetical protein